LVKEPGPVEPVGQSWGGSGALDAAGGALEEGAGAEASRGGGATLADGAGAGAVSSFEQPRRRRERVATAVRSALRIRRI